MYAYSDKIVLRMLRYTVEGVYHPDIFPLSLKYWLLRHAEHAATAATTTFTTMLTNTIVYVLAALPSGT